MPKPKSQKKESESTDFKEADLSLNDEKNETFKNNLNDAQSSNLKLQNMISNSTIDAFRLY